MAVLLLLNYVYIQKLIYMLIHIQNVYVCVNVHLRVFVPLHYIFPAAVGEEQVR